MTKKVTNLLVAFALLERKKCSWLLSGLHTVSVYSLAHQSMAYDI